MHKSSSTTTTARDQHDGHLKGDQQRGVPVLDQDEHPRDEQRRGLGPTRRRQDRLVRRRRRLPRLFRRLHQGNDCW